MYRGEILRSAQDDAMMMDNAVIYSWEHLSMRYHHTNHYANKQTLQRGKELD